MDVVLSNILPPLLGLVFIHNQRNSTAVYFEDLNPQKVANFPLRPCAFYCTLPGQERR